MRTLAYSRSPSRQSRSPSKYTSSSKTKYHGTRSKQAAFFYSYPVHTYPYPVYISNPQKRCDQNAIKITLANGTVVEDTTLITTWLTNTTMYESITTDSQVSLPCEQLNMASILGISLGLGIPMMILIILCVVLICCCCKPSNHIERLCTVACEEIKNNKEESNHVEVKPLLQPITRRKPYADEFIQDSSYIRNVAKILDNDYCIPKITFEWLEYNQPHIYEEVRVNRVEGMPEKQIAIKVMQQLVNTRFVTTKEKEKLQRFYPNDIMNILALESVATI